MDLLILYDRLWSISLIEWLSIEIETCQFAASSLAASKQAHINVKLNFVQAQQMKKKQLLPLASRTV